MQLTETLRFARNQTQGRKKGERICTDPHSSSVLGEAEAAKPSIISKSLLEAIRLVDWQSRGSMWAFLGHSIYLIIDNKVIFELQTVGKTTHSVCRKATAKFRILSKILCSSVRPVPKGKEKPSFAMTKASLCHVQTQPQTCWFNPEWQKTFCCSYSPLLSTKFWFLSLVYYAFVKRWDKVLQVGSMTSAVGSGWGSHP